MNLTKPIRPLPAFQAFFSEHSRNLAIPFFVAALFISAFAERLHAAASVNFIDFDPKIGSSRAVVVGDVPLAHTTQLLPVDGKGTLIGKGDVHKQIDKVLENLSHGLGKAGTSLDHAVKINVYAANNDVTAAVQNAFAKRFKISGPAVAFVIGNLPHPDALVAMDAIGTASGSASKDVQRLQAMMLPQNKLEAHVAILPAGAAVYISGQAKEGADLADSTRKTLESLGATLEWLKLKKSDVVSLKAFTRPMSDIAVVQKEFSQFFGNSRTPPASFVEWISQKPPIEIELIAAARDTGDKDTNSVSYLTPPGFTASNVYSKVARVNRGQKIFVSGLFANPGNGEDQVKEIFSDLRGILKKCDSDFVHLVKATYYVTDSDASNMLNKLRPKYYNASCPPAASKALISGVGMADRTLTLDMIAVPIETK